MANVKLIEARVQHILEQVLIKDQETLDAAMKYWVGSDLALEIYYNYHPRQEVTAIQGFIDGWTKTTQHHHINFLIPETENHANVLLDFGQEMPFRDDLEYSYFELAKCPMPIQNEFYRRHALYQAELKRFQDKKAATKTTIMRYKTLNQLAKVWPSVLEFVDEETKKLFNKPVAKGEKAQLEELPEELTVSIATVRLSK